MRFHSQNDLYGVFENMTDEEIVTDAKEKENSIALDFLINKYRNFVRAKARSYFLIGADREDIIQEGMIGLYKAIRDYNSEKKTYFHVFAQMCITRQIMTAVTSSNRQKHLPLNDYISLSTSSDAGDDGFFEYMSPASSKGPEEILIEKEDSENIRRTIKEKLTEKEARIVNLYMQGFSYSEMAEMTGISDKGISSTLQRVKKKLNSRQHRQD